MGSRKLLVEGESDQEFFKSYCTLLNIINVDVFPPKSIDPNTGNGCSNLINNLPILLKEIKAGAIDNLGIVLDADYPPNNNGGFTARYQLVANELLNFGYTVPKSPLRNNGEIFVHPDGLPSIGLWVMPDHNQNGMLEDFIAKLITDPTQVSLLAHANKSISKLPATLFNSTLHLTKAKVFTWRAWQQRPGLPLNTALQSGLLDRSKAAGFESWLKKVFT